MTSIQSNSTADSVRTRVRRGKRGRTWTAADFDDLDRGAVATELSRLYRKGELQRVRRGVYYCPKKTVLGDSSADPEAITDALLARKGIKAVRGGRGEYHRLGFGTQVPNVITRAADRRVRLGNIKGIRVRVHERPLNQQKGITGAERTVLDALREVDRISAVTAGFVVSRVKTLLGGKQLDFTRLARFALVEPPRVRALVGAIGEVLLRHGDDESVREEDVVRLRESLNPLTSYHVWGLEGALLTATEWNIMSAA